MTELHEPEVASDSRVQREHRTHQSWWRREMLKLPAGPPSKQVSAKYPILGNYLPEVHEGCSAAEGGWNLMSRAAHKYTRERLLVLAQTGGLAETDRLWRNMLSSQPLAFSLAGELRAHPEAAVAVFAELTGLPVVALDRLGEAGDSFRLDGIEAEWSPPRDHHTGDGSGFDIAAMLRLKEDRTLLVSVEVKYIDSFSAKALDPKRYKQHLEAIGLSLEATQAVVAGGGSQFLRSVLLTESVRRSGLRKGPGVDGCVSVVLAREDDGSADKVFRLIDGLASGVQVARWSHARLLTVAAGHPELADWAHRMRCRYVP